VAEPTLSPGLQDVFDMTILSDSVTSVRSESEELRTIARGAGISFVGYLSIIGLNLVFQLLLTRTLGAANVGILALALSIADTAAIIAMLGLQSGVLRFIALYAGQEDRAHTAGAILAGLRIVGAVSLVAAALLFGSADLIAVRVFDKPALGPVLRLLALSMPFSAILSLLLSVTQGLKRVEYRAVIEQMVMPLLKIGGLLVVVYAIGRSTLGVAYVIVMTFIVGTILATIGVWWLYPLRGQKEQPILDTRAMLAFSWPLLLTALIDRAWLETHTLMLGALAASDQVGIYYVGLRTTILLTVFLTAFSTIFAPIMAELYARHEQERLGSLLKTVTKWGFSLCLPVFLLLFFFSQEVMLVFGPEFGMGAVVLRILALSQLFNVATGPVGWLLTMSGHPGFNLLNALLILGLSLALAFLLIPRYGIIGAAVGSALSTFLVNLLRLIEVYAILRIHPYNLSYLKPIAAGCLSAITAMGLSFLMSDLPPVGRVTLSALILLLTYGAALLVLRLDAEDRVIIDACHRRLGLLVPRGAPGR
jgi:O-antigen/teichoic acid export membrane protein